MILVTGAVGNIGRELVARLAARGDRFRVLVRNPERYTPPADGCEVMEGHFGAPDKLKRALAGVDRVFLLSGVHPRMVDLQTSLIDAAVAQGVGHFVKLSGMDADPGSSLTLGRWHGEIERHIEDSGLAYTHLRPNSFMQNLLHQARQIATSGKIFAPMRDGRVSLVDVRDIAETAVAALTGDGHAGRTYTLTGPSALTYDEVAAALSQIAGRSISYVDTPPDAAREGMIAGGLPDWWADLLVELMEVCARGDCARVTDDIEHVTGHPARSFAQFAADHAKRFSA
jgi:uncharacterized protein YbjT (DUF2867 family)